MLHRDVNGACRQRSEQPAYRCKRACTLLRDQVGGTAFGLEFAEI